MTAPLSSTGVLGARLLREIAVEEGNLEDVRSRSLSIDPNESADISPSYLALQRSSHRSYSNHISHRHPVTRRSLEAAWREAFHRWTRTTASVPHHQPYDIYS